MNMELRKIRFENASDRCMVRHALGLRSQQSQQRSLECYTNKAPDMHWESWTVSRITVEQAWSVTSRTHQADMQWDRSRLTIEPAKKLGCNSAHV